MIFMNQNLRGKEILRNSYNGWRKEQIKIEYITERIGVHWHYFLATLRRAIIIRLGQYMRCIDST